MLIALAAIPVSVLPIKPRSGTNTNPAAIDPMAAPDVLAPYSLPAGPPGRVDATVTRTAIGNVAPSAIHGNSSTMNVDAIRTIVKTSDEPSSPYAQANTGVSSARLPAIESDVSPTASSSSAYVQR